MNSNNKNRNKKTPSFITAIKNFQKYPIKTKFVFEGCLR